MLTAAESARLGDAVRAVYGETYPVLWAYDADEVARRISNGVETRPGDNVAVLTVVRAGDDLTARAEAERSRLFAEGVDAVYVDLPLDRPESAHVSESLEELSLTYSGIFLNHRAAGDVLRLQSLRNATALSHDVAVASPHGAALLEYVLADMEAAGQTVVRTHDQPPGIAGEGSAGPGLPLVTTP
jgi:hypothetical protein